jgi:uncharacterized protein
MRNFIFLFLLSLFISPISVIAQGGEDNPPVTVPNSETFTLYSENVEDTYQILVALPYEYEDGSETSYPVLYVLDAAFLFGTVTEQVRLLGFNEELPPMIVVGISYPPDAPRPLQEYRGRDYIPSNDFNRRTSVDTNQFLTFITTELIPVIDENYRTLPEERGLLGYSFSGLFTLYAFSQTPITFNHYLAVSPALPWSENEMLAFADKITPSADTEFAPTVLVMSVGDHEGSDVTMANYATLLEYKGYANLTVHTTLIEDTSHYSAFGIGLIRNLLVAYGT